MSKPYAHAAPAKTRVLIRQDDDALGGGAGGGDGAAIGSDAPHRRVISSDQHISAASRGRSPSAGEQGCTLAIHQAMNGHCISTDGRLSWATTCNNLLSSIYGAAWSQS